MHETALSKVLTLLREQKGVGVTSEMFNDYIGGRFGARIYELRKLGLEITCREIKKTKDSVVYIYDLRKDQDNVVIRHGKVKKFEEVEIYETNGDLITERQAQQYMDNLNRAIKRNQKSLRIPLWKKITFALGNFFS